MSKTWNKLVNSKKVDKENEEIKEVALDYDDAIAIVNFSESNGGKEYIKKVEEKAVTHFADIMLSASAIPHAELLSKIAKLQVYTELLAIIKYAKLEADTLENVIKDILKTENED